MQGYEVHWMGGCCRLLLFGCRFRCGFRYIVVEFGGTKLIQEVKVSFFLDPVMFFSIFATAFVTETWTVVMCWKTKQGCNKIAIFVCIMQVHVGSLCLICLHSMLTASSLLGG